jgi:hypothetical protein
VEGDAIIFSADVAKKLISHQNMLDARDIDDLAIANSNKKLSIFTLHLKRPWVQIELTRFAFKFMSDSQSNPIRVRKSIEKLLVGSFAIRCKDPHIKFGHVFRLDFILMGFLNFIFKYHKS